MFAITSGALLKWDIFSLFRSQRENAQNAAGEISSELTDRKRTFLDNINIPEGAKAFPEYTEREYEILAELAHEADLTFDYGEKSLHISGYVFDGSCLDIYYDVTYPDTDTEFYFYSDDTLTASAAVPYLLYTDGNIAYYRSRNYLQLAEGIKSTEIIIGDSDIQPDDSIQNSFIVDVPSVEPVVIDDTLRALPCSALIYDTGYRKIYSADLIALAVPTVLMLFLTFPIYGSDRASGFALFARSLKNGSRKLQMYRVRNGIILSATFSALFYFAMASRYLFLYGTEDILSDAENLIFLPFQFAEIPVAVLLTFIFLMNAIIVVCVEIGVCFALKNWCQANS